MKKKVLAAALLLSTFCSARDQGGLTLQTDFRTMSPEQSLALLQGAGNIQVKAPKGKELGGMTSDVIEACNGKRTKNFNSHALEDVCARAGFIGSSDPEIILFKMEALFRGCGVYAGSNDQSSGGVSCGRLGGMFFAIGNITTAKAIWEAPGCYTTDRTESSMNGCLQYVLGGGKENIIFKRSLVGFPLHQSPTEAYASDPERLLQMARQSCKTAHDPASCEFLNSKGEAVDMTAVANAANERHEALQEVRERNDANLARSQAESEARRNAMLGALSTMPGGSDPNAIVSAGNQQAAAIRAVGDANTARQQAAAQQQIATQQAASADAVKLQPANSSWPDTQSASNISDSAAVSNPSTSTHERCPSTRVFPDAGVNCNPVRSTIQCVKIVSSSWSGNATQNFGVLTVTLANTCLQGIRLTITGGKQANTDGETSMVGGGQQYTFSDTQHDNQYFYVADDGTDCFANNLRPGCRLNK